MARLVIIRDVFEGHKREIVDVPIGAPIADYLPKDFILNPKRTQFIFNGKVIKKPLYEFVSNDEELIVRCFPGVTGAMFVAAGATVPFWAIASAFAINMIIGLVVGFALNAIINAIMPPPKPENQPTNGSTEGSATYGWDGIQNTVRNGTPIQLVYGVHKIAGQYLSTFTKAVADGKNKLYMLIGLGAGPFSAINGYTTDQDSITPDTDDLKLEGNTIDSYADVAVSQRLGNWDQSIISGFNDVVVPQSQNKSITSTPDTVTTIGDVEAVELQLRFPGGLYRMDAYGSFLPYDCQIRYRWRLSGGSYGGYTTLTFSAETRSQYNVMERIDFPSSATYQIELERVTADDGGAGDTKYAISIVSLMAVNEISYDDVNYNGVALLSVEAVASEQLNGQLPTVTSIVHGKEVSVYRPADTLGKDTEQNFLANEKLLWGWSTGNYKTIRANNLKLHLKFNESSGTDAADSSGEGNNGTITNMAGTEWTASKCANMGNALNFDGVNDYVDCGSDDSLRITGDRTLSAWVRLSAGTFPDATTNWIIAYNEDYQDYGFVWDIKGSTARQYFRTSQAGAYTYQTSNTALENNTWYHLAVVISSGTLTFYLDGVADGGGAITAQVPSTYPFLISRSIRTFDGILDEIRVQNTALTANEIEVLYKSGADTLLTYGSAEGFNANLALSEMGALPEFYRFTDDGGRSYEYWTSWDTALTFGGNVYSPAPIARSGFSVDINFSPVSLTLKIPLDVGSIMAETVASTPPPPITVTIYQATVSDLSASVILFQGTAKIASASGKLVTLQFEQQTKVLDTHIPIKHYQAFCNHGVFDTGCGLRGNSRTWYVNCTITGISGAIYTSAEFDAYADNYFRGGQLIYENETRLITAHTGDSVVLQVPFRSNVTFGTSVRALPGCDGDPETCINKFDNFTNFLGMPYIPIVNPTIYGVK